MYCVEHNVRITSKTIESLLTFIHSVDINNIKYIIVIILTFLSSGYQDLFLISLSEFLNTFSLVILTP